MIYASTVAPGFYDPAITPTGKMPVDAVPISAALYQSLLADQATGRVIDFTVLPPVSRAPPAPPAPTLAQQGAAAIAAGCALQSTGTPALDGTYSCDAPSQHKIMAASLYIAVNGRFPGGATSYAWLDVTGAPHVFADVGAFQVFATAIADYVAALDQIAATNSGALPAQPMVIA